MHNKYSKYLLYNQLQAKMSKYSKLPDEILMKKIATMTQQVKTTVESLKTIPDLDMDISEFDNVGCNENMSRIEMEQTCDKLTDILNTLKTKQKNATLAQQEAQKQAAQMQKSQNQNDADDDENAYVDVKPKYEVITSLETIKRAFFNPTNEDYVSMPFASQITEHPFVFYKGIYKYSDDMNNKPEYIARNFNKSFVKRMEEYGKYVFAMFTCTKVETPDSMDTQYKYESYMLINSVGAFEDFIIKDNDDVLFEKIDLQTFLEHFKQDNTIFDTLFVH